MGLSNALENLNVNSEHRFPSKPGLLIRIPGVKLFVSMDILLCGLGGRFSELPIYRHVQGLEKNKQRFQFQRLAITISTVASTGETRNGRHKHEDVCPIQHFKSLLLTQSERLPRIWDKLRLCVMSVMRRADPSSRSCGGNGRIHFEKLDLFLVNLNSTTYFAYGLSSTHGHQEILPARRRYTGDHITTGWAFFLGLMCRADVSSGSPVSCNCFQMAPKRWIVLDLGFSSILVGPSRDGQETYYYLNHDIHPLVTTRFLRSISGVA